MSPLEAAGLLLTGFGASVLGSLLGLGGGFIVIPVLRVVFKIPPADVAGTSLVLVFANVLTATFGYARGGFVDWRLGIPFVAGALPASALGVFVVKHFSPAQFDAIYGALLVSLSLIVMRRRNVAARPVGEKTFAHRPAIGVLAGFATGLVSSIFGIGGGIVFVPLLLIAARISPFVVTATSAMIIAFTAPVGIAVHAIEGDVAWLQAIPLVAGGLGGGVVGPLIAKRLRSQHLVTMLSVALMLAALLLVLRHL